MENTKIKEKLKEQLIGTGWDAKLRFFLLNSEIDKILAKLKDDVAAGNRFTPPIKKVFEPFVACHYDKVRIVILSDKPSISPEFNDGLALSVPSNLGSYGIAKNIHSAIAKTVYEKSTEEYDTDLHRWAEQGVLLLNESLTTRMENATSTVHIETWKPFISFIMDLFKKREDIIFLFLGGAVTWADLVPDAAIKYEFPDLWKTYGAEWDEQVFNKINAILEARGQEKIIW